MHPIIFFFIIWAMDNIIDKILKVEQGQLLFLLYPERLQTAIVGCQQWQSGATLDIRGRVADLIPECH